MTKISKKRIILSAILCLVLCLTLFTPFLIPARAAESQATTYSNVLDDLKKDENFNPADFPDNPTDYSLQVITVAEGVNGELFVYVYQPSNATKDLRASKINMSLVDPTTIKPGGEILNNLYDLTWLNSNGVFDKYLVNDFKVSSDPYRYYDITAIYRPFDASLGDISNVGEDEITNLKGYPVGKFWSMYYYNGVFHTESAQIKVVPITINHTGSISYDNGTLNYSSSCYGFYVAFSIEGYDVQHIYDADIEYTYTNHSIINGVHSTFSPVTITDFISDKETGGNSGHGILGKKYTWERIVDITSFEESVKADTNQGFDEELKAKLSSSEFVFRFAEFSRIHNTNSLIYTEVDNVSVLRLHFLTPLGTYNLGAVSDVVTGSNIPDMNVTKLDNIQNSLEEISDFFKALIKIIALVVLILIFLALQKPIAFILKLVKKAVEIIFWILTSPFRFFGWLFKSK